MLVAAVGWSLMAHRDISRRRNNSVAFGVKRTFSDRTTASIKRIGDTAERIGNAAEKIANAAGWQNEAARR